jgi:hypothetical protein
MALIKTIDELKLYINVDVNMKFSKMKPHIEEAESIFIIPLLGKDFYEEVLEAYTAAPSPALTADLVALLPYIQKALACYAGFVGSDELGVALGDLGFQQQSNTNSQPAPMGKVTNLKLKYLNSGDRAADFLLEFLEFAAIIPDGGDEEDRLYKTWYDSDANTALSGAIVYKTSIANKYIDIGDSRRVFLRLKKRIKDIEAVYVKRMICKDQYDVIIAHIRAGTLTINERALIEKLEPMISKRALHGALPGLPVMITAEGLFLLSSNDGAVQKLQAGLTEKQALLNDLKIGDFGYEGDELTFISFLKENIANYPLISASPCWTDPVTTSDEKWKVPNDPCNKHFST